MIKIVVHWPKLGRYHIARLNALHKLLDPHEMMVVGLEIAGGEEAYLWGKESGSSEFPRCTVFPDHTYERLPAVLLVRGVVEWLNAFLPDIVLVNGYSTIDALAILFWARLNRRPSILMCETKEDDYPRTSWKESLKRWLVKQYQAAICGGSLHEEYLQSLGMQGDRIFHGYDVVDNAYFRSEAELARKNPSNYRSLPGLETSGPYFLASSRFLPRKNIIGLLREYRRYRDMMADEGKQAWGLIVLGDGEERTRVEKLIIDWKIKGVTLAGSRPMEELPVYYGLAQVFIHPALQEQWGLVVNEAMAAGLPVLVSEGCGCAPELVEWGINGYTFDPNDEDELASLLYLMCSQAVDLHQMREASAALIEGWGLERFAKGVIGAVKRTLEEPYR